MAMAGKIGATLQIPGDAPAPHGWLFGEDQGRYLISTTNAEAILAAAEKAGVPAIQIGLTGSNAISIVGGNYVELDKIRQTNESWLPDYMAVGT